MSIIYTKLRPPSANSVYLYDVLALFTHADVPLLPWFIERNGWGVQIKRKIKVLIVDDSLLFRESLARGLSADAAIDVVATAHDAYSARDRIIDCEPDVMILDVELPKMNGIEFLRRLMPQYPIPVVVVSSISNNVFEALTAGAVDFVSKPDSSQQGGFEFMLKELTIKIKIASTANVAHWKCVASQHKITERMSASAATGRIIAIGASTGGTEAIAYILKSFPVDMPGIVIVQHMPPVFTRMYADRLNNTCLMEIREASNGDQILPGRVLIAPGDYQMCVKKSGQVHTVECIKGEKVNGHCPSVDVLFESVAQQVSAGAVGVILSGMGNDGARGLLAMQKKGALTIGQDEQSCVVYGMPKAAYNLGAVQKQLALSEIPQIIYSLINKR